MSGVVCAVCYEDLKPASEHLQAVTACGHVFHELCFQQWLEYCHRKPSCPVCKHVCTRTDVHRLFFNASGDLTQQTQPASCENQEMLEVKVQKLEAQISIANRGLDLNKVMLKDLDQELSNYKVRLEKAQSARCDAVAERDHYKEAHFRTQKDLNKCLEERAKLFEKNTSLAKELASMKLVANFSLDEEEILRLATVGQGRNKDDIIDTLTRSLVIRNKSYSDLVTKYGSLGMNEKAALQKADKAKEQSKRLKMRVQELERILEEKENRELRALKQRNSKSETSKVYEEEIDLTAPEAVPSSESTKVHIDLRLEEHGLQQSENAISTSLLQIPIRREVPSNSPGDFSSTSVDTVNPSAQVDRKRVYGGFQHVTSSTEKGSFILTGADGRGGKVTVLKPAQHLGIRTSTVRQVKRCKPTLPKGSKSGAMHIDQFFGRAEVRET